MTAAANETAAILNFIVRIAADGNETCLTDNRSIRENFLSDEYS